MNLSGLTFNAEGTECDVTTNFLQGARVSPKAPHQLNTTRKSKPDSAISAINPHVYQVLHRHMTIEQNQLFK